LFLDIELRSRTGNRSINKTALVDSGATSNFINWRLVLRHKITTVPLPQPVIVRNVDNSENVLGKVTHKVFLAMNINGHREVIRFFVTDLGKDDIILGHSWLRKHNPNIDWREAKLDFSRCSWFCQMSMDDKWRRHTAPKADFIAGQRRKPRVHVVKGSPQKTKKQVRFTVPLQEDIPTYEDNHLIHRFISTTDPNHDDEFFIAYPDSQEIRRTTQATELAAAENSTKEQKTFEERVPRHYQSFKSVFEEQASRGLPPRKKWDHAIDLKPDAIPSNNCKIYPLNVEEQKTLDAFLADMLERGYIRDSQSPFASPFFFVKKKDGKLRPVQDYRQLNSLTIKNQYPLPLISDVVDKLKDARIFTKFDIRWGYNNIRIKEGDEWKAAFKTNRGMYEPLVMFFGLMNSPATFQAMMNDTFKDLIETGKVFIYMDDILIATATIEEHRELVKQVLQRLADNNLFLKPEKCEFEQTEVEYLGMRLQQGQIAMDPIKLKGIADWPAPKNLRDVRAFLGFAGFYRRFIRNFSRLARPLNDLTQKNQKWVWGEEQNHAFETLRQRFMEAPVLIQPDVMAPFRLECDASKRACGAVLSQQGDDGHWHPVAFMSKSFIEAERNYDIYDRELLAIIRALEEWRHYLEGSPHKIEILSDHKNLEVFKEARKLTRRQARWALYLSRFDFQITHVAGRTAGKPDTLSRRPDHDNGDNDNEDRILLPTDLFSQSPVTNLYRNTITLTLEDADLRQRIKDCQAIDKDMVTILQYIQAKRPLNLGRDFKELWSVMDGLLIYDGRIAVPHDPDLRTDIVKRCHDSITAGHPGRVKTFELVQQTFWWYGMRKFTYQYVDGCATCQSTKNLPNRPHVPLVPIPPTEDATPFATVSMDFIMDLPLSNGFDAITVFVDHDITKATVIVPCNTTITAEQTARLYQDNVWRRFGLPKKIISDRGTQFTSRFTQELCRLLGITQAMSTAYHPQTDGQTERMNQELEQYLRAFCNARQTDWSTFLSTAEFAHNSRKHSTIGQTPFYTLMGYEPLALPTVLPTSSVPAVSDRLSILSSVRDDIVAAQHIAHRQWTDNTPFPSYQINDQVWLEGKHLATSYPSAKLAPRRYGPFPISAIINPVTFRLSLPPTWKIHPVFHASLLSPYRETPEHGPNFTRPPPELIDGEEEFVIEEIIDSRMFRGKLQYLVKWEGYPTSDNQWLPVSELNHAPDLIEQFHLTHPTASSSSSDPDSFRRPRRGRRPIRGG
jgi:hypothetical protein